jgi:hypothetical protein
LNASGIISARASGVAQAGIRHQFRALSQDKQYPRIILIRKSRAVSSNGKRLQRGFVVVREMGFELTLQWGCHSQIPSFFYFFVLFSARLHHLSGLHRVLYFAT